MKKLCIHLGYADEGCERYKCCGCGEHVEMRALPKFCCYCGVEFSEVKKYTTSVRWKLAVIKKEGGKHSEFYAEHLAMFKQVWDPLAEREPGYLTKCVVQKDQALEVFVGGKWEDPAWHWGNLDEIDEAQQRLRIKVMAYEKDEQGRPASWTFGMANVTYYKTVQERSCRL